MSRFIAASWLTSLTLSTDAPVDEVPIHLPTDKLRLAHAGQACVMMGDFDCAVGYIRRVLTEPRLFSYTPAIFGLDPIWQPLRERTDFKALTAQR